MTGQKGNHELTSAPNISSKVKDHLWTTLTLSLHLPSLNRYRTLHNLIYCTGSCAVMHAMMILQFPEVCKEFRAAMQISGSSNKSSKKNTHAKQKPKDTDTITPTSSTIPLCQRLQLTLMNFLYSDVSICDQEYFILLR